jgi:hypothetical protein
LHKSFQKLKITQNQNRRKISKTKFKNWKIKSQNFQYFPNKEMNKKMKRQLSRQVRAKKTILTTLIKMEAIATKEQAGTSAEK